MPRRAVLVTGGLATGKTAVIAELVAIAAERRLPAAAVDLDWLGWATGIRSSPAQLVVRNLELLAPTYADAGVDRLALARGIVDAGGVASLQTALRGWALSVVRLVASPDAARRRLAARDTGAELAAHLDELARFEEQVALAAGDAPAIDSGDRSIRDVALDVWRVAAWDE